jgi:hypothetical protein
MFDRRACQSRLFRRSPTARRSSAPHEICSGIEKDALTDGQTSIYPTPHPQKKLIGMLSGAFLMDMH